MKKRTTLLLILWLAISLILMAFGVSFIISNNNTGIYIFLLAKGIIVVPTLIIIIYQIGQNIKFIFRARRKYST